MAYHYSCCEAKADEDIGILCACVKSKLHQTETSRTPHSAMSFCTYYKRSQCVNSRTQELAHMSGKPSRTGLLVHQTLCIVLQDITCR